MHATLTQTDTDVHTYTVWSKEEMNILSYGIHFYIKFPLWGWSHRTALFPYTHLCACCVSCPAPPCPQHSVCHWMKVLNLLRTTLTVQV